MILETTALISVGTWLGNKILDKGFDSIYSKVTSKKFNKKFYEKVELSATRLQKLHPDALGGNIEYFFKHEEVFSELIKLLFLNSKVDLSIIENKFQIDTLPKDFILEFIKILREELYKDQYFNDILSSKEIYLATIGLSKSIGEVQKITNLSYVEIKQMKNFLSEKFKNSFSRKQFLNSYMERVISSFSQVNFIGLGVDLSIKKGKRKDIEDLFVMPKFSTSQENIDFLGDSVFSKIEESTLSLSTIFNYTSNLIILGDPGSGKSLLTKYIALSLCKPHSDLFKNEDICIRIPFRIELRKFFAHKREFKQGMLKYFRHHLESEFGFSNILLEDIHDLLLKNKSLVIFDGFDEIFDLEDKLSVKRDIENFSKEYANSRIITTSRIIGYEESSLNENDTLRIIINKFDDRQVEEYINNWYKIEEEDAEIRKKEISDLWEKRKLIPPEIISNPLLLSLIVILYRNNLKVPESKLEIYQSCTKTLVDKWDNSKNIEINLTEEIYKRKDTIFSDLAYWQYNILSSTRGKVTYQSAKNTIAKTLQKKLKLTDEFTSDLTAEQFLEYAQKRSLYFDNNFTHKTFLEYYTAYWIYSNIEKKHKKEDRDLLISKYINNPYWHIVLELLLNLIDKDQADNEIMDELIDYQLNNSRGANKFFLNIFNSLRNTSNDIFKRVVKSAIFDLLHEDTSEESAAMRHESIYHILVSNTLIEPYNNLRIESFEEIYSDFKEYFSRKNSHFADVELFVSAFLEIEHQAQDFSYKKLTPKPTLIDEKAKELQVNNPFIFIITTLIYNNDEFILNPLSFANKFLKLFGPVKYYSRTKGHFATFVFFPFGRIVLRELLFHESSDLYCKYLKLLSKYEISDEVLIKDIFINSLFIDNDTYLNNILSKVNDSPRILTKMLIVGIIFRIVYPKFHRSRSDFNLNSKIQIINDTVFKSKLREMTTKKNVNKAILYIEKEFSFNLDFLEEKQA